MTAPVGVYAGLDTPSLPLVTTFNDVDTWAAGSTFALGAGYYSAKLVSVALAAPDVVVAQLPLAAQTSALITFTPQQNGAPVMVLQEPKVGSSWGRLLLASVDAGGRSRLLSSC